MTSWTAECNPCGWPDHLQIIHIISNFFHTGCKPLEIRARFAELCKKKPVELREKLRWEGEGEINLYQNDGKRNVWRGWRSSLWPRAITSSVKLCWIWLGCVWQYIYFTAWRKQQGEFRGKQKHSVFSFSQMDQNSLNHILALSRTPILHRQSIQRAFRGGIYTTGRVSHMISVQWRLKTCSSWRWL